MDIFISWSGTLSKAVAIGLRDWLPNIFHAADPFVSAKDIPGGSRWSDEIADRLERTSFGIICVTKENQGSEWLNFEAGALAKTVQSTYVVPIAIDLAPSDIKYPLGQFQGVPMDRDGIWDLVRSINNAGPTPTLDAERLTRIFDKFWDDLDGVFQEAITSAQGGRKKVKPDRTDKDMLQELVLTVRAINAQLSSQQHGDQRLEPDLVQHVRSVVNELAPSASVRVLMDKDTGEEFLRVSDRQRVSPEVRELLNELGRVNGVRVTYSTILPRRKEFSTGDSTAE